MPVKELAVWYCSSDLEIGKEFFDLFGESAIKNGTDRWQQSLRPVKADAAPP
jgi:hypothetical protein